MSDRILFAPAGWEERFELGVGIDILEFNPTKVVVPFSTEYAERTLPFRAKVSQRAQDVGITYVEAELDYRNVVSQYNGLLSLFEAHVFTSEFIRFNATSAPRDLIWHALHFLNTKKIDADFSYFRPTSYGTYVSRDARSPRFMLKRSGIAYPDLPTCILALSGYDEERLSQLRHRYEPKKMLIGRQIGSQLGNDPRNVSVDLEPHDGVECFDFDAFDISDESVKLLSAKLDQLPEPHNIIAASLGPKPSAATLFKLTELRPEIGLVYIPAGDYNPDYSQGIDLENRTLTELKWRL